MDGKEDNKSTADNSNASVADKNLNDSFEFLNLILKLKILICFF